MYHGILFLKTFKIGEAADGYLLKSLNVCLVKVRGGVLFFAGFFFFLR